MQDVSRTSRPIAPVASVPSTLQAYFRQLTEVVSALPFDDIEEVVDLLLAAWVNERHVFVFGNGGSAATASHMICDLTKGTIPALGCRRLKATAFTDNVPLLTAWSNDFGYEYVFAEQLKTFAEEGDVAFAISGSGNSPNVLNALHAAREMGVSAVGLAGYKGGKMKDLCDICVVVPCNNMQVIEDVHHSVAHSIFTMLKWRMESIARSDLAVATGTNG